jgi:hypothetical protein
MSFAAVAGRKPAQVSKPAAIADNCRRVIGLVCDMNQSSAEVAASRSLLTKVEVDGKSWVPGIVPQPVEFEG